MYLSTLHHRSLWAPAGLSSHDVSALLGAAQSLKDAAAAGQPLQPLRGKNIAVMCESPDDPALQEFSAAAGALGARVAHIRPDGSPHTTQLLGLLYDAIECVGLPQALVEEVERGAGRPVYNGLAVATHPLRALDAMVPVGDTPATGRQLVLQAALLCSAMN